MQFVTVGPFALPLDTLLVLAGWVAAMAIGGVLQRRGRPSTDAQLWYLLLAGMLAARLAFVVRWWPEYAGHPLAMMDLRDGGLSRRAGSLAVIVGAAWIGWKRRPLRAPLAWAVLGGMMVWWCGSVVVWRLDTAMHTPLPALALSDVAGRPVGVQQLRGRPLVINLWASWCGPCRREMPVLAEAQQTHPQLRFVFANQGDSPEQIRAFIATNQLRLADVLVDPSSKLSQQFSVRGYPTTLFFDAQGTLRSVHIGELSPATLAAEVRRIVPRVAVASPHSSGASQ